MFIGFIRGAMRKIEFQKGARETKKFANRCLKQIQKLFHKLRAFRRFGLYYTVVTRARAYVDLFRCVKLDVTEHVRSTANECGNWAKKTYWRLWSECHFLSCRTCGQPYPVKNSAMCRYHPERAEYAPIGNLNLEQPTGT